jgi:VRR-NUC domain-containing protein
LFGDPRVREFVDELVRFRISRKQVRGIGASIDLIASRESSLHLIEVKSSDARLEQHQMKALEIARMHGIQTGVVRVKFLVSFDHAELYHVRTNQDARIVSNIPDETLD